MIARIILAFLAVSAAFFAEVFFFPALAINLPLQCTYLALIMAAPRIPLAAALFLGGLCGLFLSSVGTMPLSMRLPALVAAAGTAWWLSRHALSQRSILSVGAITIIGFMVAWLPDIIRFGFSAWPFIWSGILNAIFSMVVAFPFLARARLADARVRSQRTAWS